MLRSKLFLGALAAGMLVAGAAFAAVDLSATYGNTITWTDAAGSKTVFWLMGDGTFTAKAPGGEAKHGTWEISGTQFCGTYDGETAKNCMEVPHPDQAWVVGEKTPGKNFDGGDITIEVSPGQTGM